MSGLDKYYKEYVNHVHKKVIKSKKDLVIEIASNDGILLQHLINKTKVALDHSNQTQSFKSS